MNKPLKTLIARDHMDPYSRVAKKYRQFDSLLKELQQKHLTEDIIVAINDEVELLNAIDYTDNKLGNTIKKAQNRILKSLENELELVPKNHYRNLWIALGMAAIGIPLGTILGTVLDNMAFISLGLPIGMAIGIFIGIAKDKKAVEYGKQLEIEIKY